MLAPSRPPYTSSSTDLYGGNVVSYHQHIVIWTVITLTGSLVAAAPAEATSGHLTQHGSASVNLPLQTEEADYHLPDLQVEVYGVTMELAHLRDYEQMALEDGVDLEIIIEKYHWQHEFADVVTELATTYPDEFAGAAITNNSQDGWIAFKGSTPADAISLAASISKPVVTISNRGFSESELAQVLEENYYAGLSHPDIVNGEGSSDQETGAITITLQPREGLTPEEQAEVLDEIESQLPGTKNPTSRSTWSWERWLSSL